MGNQSISIAHAQTMNRIEQVFLIGLAGCRLCHNERGYNMEPTFDYTLAQRGAVMLVPH